MSRFLHSKFNALDPYDTSGELESMNGGYIRLNTNESPFELSEKVMSSAGEAARALNFYSDPDCTRLCEKLSGLMQVNPSEIVFGNGSDEILNFIFMAFCEHGAAFPDIAYSFYKILAKFHGVDFLTVPLDENFKINPDDYKNFNGRTIIITNPNAPTGIFLELKDVEKIINQNPDSLIIIDEAYIDFGDGSAKNLIHQYKNLIVVRTFSKSRSMAGARLGWCMTCEEIARDMNNIKNTITPYNINAMTQAVALAVLEDEESTQKNIDTIKKIRDDTKNKLREIGFEVLDSSANFLFARHEKISGEEIFEALKRKKIMIRHFSRPERISNFNRITIGTPEQMKIFLEAIKGVVNE
ncbi:MAG: histidinol-phosphate transaminase [Synergistales bacterium]|nr:histidinol-phosphate transaminase [Synergistales bacterium]MDY6401429.1 histidinol-phosphate transaminase [Synergistales bacterium]MDY6404944.1 histidinol-phosphate transaminase [Synergistales bacterium]MDY6410359.1 histidinol-phosphate transaminase [Synergistales bacterium]MDY6414293.1 histidinol-phosphate transaminase [Synergistales bacterium]